MSRIIAYTYVADVHCPDCARKDYENGAFKTAGADTDEHGLPEDCEDREGNPIHPVFSTDERNPNGEYCGDCHCCIVEPFKYHGCFDGLRGLEIEMTLEQAESASHQGQCDEDVETLTKLPEIAAQLDSLLNMNPDVLRRGLKESGAWDAEELADDEENRRRAVWLAACDIRENIKH